MVAGGTEGALFLAARVLFGGVLAFMGLNHFMQVDSMAGYAEHKGLPAQRLSVLFSGGLLLFAGAAIVAGVFPVLVGFALATFLLVSAFTMHDFWAVPDEQTQDEMTQFLKNVALAGGALALAATGTSSWAFSAGVSLF
jgi:putative oxidoreductase